MVDRIRCSSAVAGSAWRSRAAGRGGIGSDYPVPEYRQVLSRWPVLKIRKRVGAAHPYVIRNSDGIAVKRFLRRFQAEWWLERYENRRIIRASQLEDSDKKPRPLDVLTERWLISDCSMCYPERVVEILVLLKAGLA